MKRNIFIIGIVLAMSILLIGSVIAQETVTTPDVPADVWNQLMHLIRGNQYTIVGTSRTTNDCSTSHNVAGTVHIAKGVRYTHSASDYCGTSYGLFDVFLNGYSVHWREFKNFVDVICGSTGGCDIELYCCNHVECQGNSDCSWVGSNALCKTASCSYISSGSQSGGYWCTSDYGTETDMPYAQSSFTYCKAGVQISKTCWYNPSGSSSCLSVTYPGQDYCPPSYLYRTLYDSESSCLSNIPPPECVPNCAGKTCGNNGCSGSCGSCNSGQTCTNDNCVDNAPTCTDHIQNQGETGIDCGGPCVACENPSTYSCLDSYKATDNQGTTWYCPNYASDFSQGGILLCHNQLCVASSGTACTAPTPYWDAVNAKCVSASPSNGYCDNNIPCASGLTCCSGSLCKASCTTPSPNPTPSNKCTGTGRACKSTIIGTACSSTEVDLGKLDCSYGTTCCEIQEKYSCAKNKGICRSSTNCLDNEQSVGHMDCGSKSNCCAPVGSSIVNGSNVITPTSPALTFADWKTASPGMRIKTVCSLDENCQPYTDLSGNNLEYTVKCQQTAQILDQLNSDYKTVCDSSWIKKVGTQLSVLGGVGCAASIAATVLCLPTTAVIVNAPVCLAAGTTAFGICTATAAIGTETLLGCGIWAQADISKGACIAVPTTSSGLDTYLKWAALFDINGDGVKDGTDGLIIIVIGVVLLILVPAFIRK